MYFKRQNTNVVLEWNSKLGTCKPVFPFSFDCGDDQEYAELVTRHFNKLLEDWKEEIAKEFYLYIDDVEVTKLKRKLNKEWDSKNNFWK